MVRFHPRSQIIMEGKRPITKKEEEFLHQVKRDRENQSLLTDRDINFYEYLLGFEIKNLKDKSVLDLGSGMTEKFSKQVNKLDSSVRIFSLSPTEYNIAVRTKKSVMARAQEMPYSDNSFDYELALFSVPLYLSPEIENYKSFIAEVVRTLKPKGRALIFPVHPKEEESKLLTKVLNMFKKNIRYKFEDVGYIRPDDQRLVIMKK